MANRRGLIGAGVVAGLAATVAAVPYFIDWSFFEPQMIAAVENATGYDVEVGGELRFTLLPRPALVVDQVAITGFGAERQPLIRAEQLSAAVAFWPLFGKRVEVHHIALKTPVVRMVSYADGSNNWSRPDEAGATSSTSTSAKVCSRPPWSSSRTESSSALRCSLVRRTPVPTHSGHQPCLLL